MPAFVSRVFGWVDNRVGLRDLIRTNLTGYGIPKRASGILFCLGGLALLFFISQIVTGILLLVHYEPTVASAYHSVKRITLEVPFGWFVRGLHSYGATIMVLAVLLHGFRVFMFAEYKAPRELHWVTGILLLLLTLGLAFSGYLLPWTQLSYWGSTVGTETLRGVPFFGDDIVRLVRGGNAVGEPTLHRFFALHVVVLPLLLLGLFGVHIYLVRRTGQGGPPTIQPGEPKLPFFPSHVAKELFVFSVLLFLLAFLILYGPEHADQPADPYNTPPHIKPEWYFLASYQFLKLIRPEWLALALQGCFLGLLILWPFVDRSPERDLRRRPLLLGATIVTVIALIGLSVWGKYS
ncbi:MAG: cytochrome bc complex cytochrome b subunit [Planctomycetota bacterium]